MKNLGECRHEISCVTHRDLPAALAVLVTTWNKCNETFISLSTQQKLAWGKAVMAIRASHAEMRSGITRQAQQLAQQASAERQACPDGSRCLVRSLIWLPGTGDALFLRRDPMRLHDPTSLSATRAAAMAGAERRGGAKPYMALHARLPLGRHVGLVHFADCSLLDYFDRPSLPRVRVAGCWLRSARDRLTGPRRMRCAHRT